MNAIYLRDVDRAEVVLYLRVTIMEPRNNEISDIKRELLRTIIRVESEGTLLDDEDQEVIIATLAGKNNPLSLSDKPFIECGLVLALFSFTCSIVVAGAIGSAIPTAVADIRPDEKAMDRQIVFFGRGTWTALEIHSRSLHLIPCRNYCVCL